MSGTGVPCHNASWIAEAETRLRECLIGVQRLVLEESVVEIEAEAAAQAVS